MKLQQQANAKINLGLRILGKLPDGYHTIETIFLELDWGDILTAEPYDELMLVRCGLSSPAGEDNLILKAARKLRETLQVTHGAKITLDKRVPLGSGLGGGSSDAAITLQLLARLWRLDLRRLEIAAIAKQLGADVPFFLTGGSAYATGIGNEITPVTMPYYPWVLVFYPGWEISTSWAYRQWDLLKRETAFPLPLNAYLDLAIDNPEFHRIFSNDFQPIVFRKYPALKFVSDRLWESGADFVSLSGSGSSLFGFFSRQDRAKSALKWAQTQGQAVCTRCQLGERSETE